MTDKPNYYPLSLLIGRELASVEFVRDYYIMRFDGPYITILSNSSITNTQQTYAFASSDFCCQILKCINEKVKDVSINESIGITLTFDNNYEVFISLKHEDYICAEALIFTDDESKIWNVW